MCVHETAYFADFLRFLVSYVLSPVLYDFQGFFVSLLPVLDCIIYYPKVGKMEGSLIIRDYLGLK